MPILQTLWQSKCKPAFTAIDTVLVPRAGALLNFRQKLSA